MKELEKRRQERLLEEKKREVRNVTALVLNVEFQFFRDISTLKKKRYLV